MDFQETDQNVAIAIETICINGENITISIRLDCRDGLARVDMKSWAPMPWEAIDNGIGFNNVCDAEAYANRYVNAVKAQQTLHPIIER